VQRLRDYISRALGFSPSESLDPILEEQLHRVRHAILHARGEKPVRSILVTSAIDGEGKTTVSSGLARSIARSLDHKALLVECDLRRPRIAKLFGLANEPGLIGHMVDGKPLAKVVRSTDVPKLSVISAGGELDEAANLLSSSYMKRFVKEVAETYPDHVAIFDAPPALATPEALALAEIVDAVIFVVRAESTPRDLVRQAIAALPRDRILGVAFNAVPLTKRDRRMLFSYYLDQERVERAADGAAASAGVR
jgi:protein-tyrosine kinase